MQMTMFFYAFGSNLEEIKIHLRGDLTKISRWFTKTYVIPNPDKCHYMYLGKIAINDMLKFCEVELEVSKLEMVLVIEIDCNLGDFFQTRCSKAAEN